MLPGGSAKRAPKKKRSGFKPSAAGKAYAAPKYTPAPSRSDAAQRHGARTPKPKPYRPTPKQVESSRAQERAYKSQGKAVKKVAHVQKAQGVGRPTGGRTLVTRVEAARKAQRGQRREREAKAITKLVGFDPRDRYNNTPRKTKTNVMPVPKGLKKAYDLGYLETDKAKLETAGFAPPGLAEKIVSAPKYAIKYTAKPAAELSVNASKDIGELAVGTPTSLVHMGDIAQKGVRESVKQGSLKPAAKAGEEIGKGVIEPYKQLVKDPIGFATKHPVSTALMVLPAGKIPGRTAGRVARVAGKQTLHRTPATLPGTSLKTQRVGSRSAGRRAVQARRDTGSKRISDHELNTLVDEDFDLGQLQKHAAQASKSRVISKDLGRLTPKERARRVSPKRETRKQHREEVKARREREGGPGPLSVRERARRAPRAVSPVKEVRQRHAAEKAELSERIQHEISGAAKGGEQTAERAFARRYGSHYRVERDKPTTKLKKTGETEKVIKHPEPGSREAYIAERPKPAHGDPDPTVERLTENVKPGKPGITIEREYIRQVDPHTREQVGWGRQVPGYDDKVVVARDASGKPIGALKMIVDEHGQPTVMEVAVDPAHRGKGIATKLVKAAHDAGYDVAKAAREGGLTEAGAALVHKNLAKRAAELPIGTLKIGHYKPKVKKGKKQVVEPKDAPEGSGVIHASRKDAQLVADEITRRGLFEPEIKKITGDTPGVTGGYAVVPKAANKRLNWHHKVGQQTAPGAVVLRTSNRAFRRAVLPTSFRWLTGQAVEGVVRAAAMGAGPTSLLRYRRVMKELRKIDAKEGTKHAEAFERRAVSGGAYGDTGPIAAYTGNNKTLAEEFKGTGPRLEKVAETATRIGQMPIVGLKGPRKAYGRYTKVVFQDVNGAIERVAKKAMAGKAIKQGPLMERSLIDLSGKAAREAAQGLRETSHQVEAARQTVRAYGKYSQMSPAMRETILHTTPFIPWMLNMGRFLVDVMPRDHPVKTSLVAAMNAGDQEWRMSKGLSFEGKNRRPDFLMGSYPVGKNKFVPVGRFGPFAPADIVGDIAGQVAPQYTTALANAAFGVDWKGNKIRGNMGVRALNAGISQAEAMVPGLGVLGRATGASEAARLQHKKEPKPSIVRGNKKISSAALDTVNPFRAIEAAPPKKKKGKAKSSSGFGGGSISSGGFGSGGLK